MEKLINRNSYLSRLIDKRENGLIKVVTGIRRCGKSYLLFYLFKDYLIENGIKEEQIISIALDDDTCEQYRDPDALSKFIRSKIVSDKSEAYEDYSLERAKEQGCHAVCFEGNIDFYGKSGFDYASKFGIRYNGMPADADTSFFLCKELTPGYLEDITGDYRTPEGYMIDEEAANEFDKQFPYKERLVLPGQLI